MARFLSITLNFKFYIVKLFCAHCFIVQANCRFTYTKMFVSSVHTFRLKTTSSPEEGYAAEDSRDDEGIRS